MCWDKVAEIWRWQSLLLSLMILSCLISFKDSLIFCKNIVNVVSESWWHLTQTVAIKHFHHSLTVWHRSVKPSIHCRLWLLTIINILFIDNVMISVVSLLIITDTFNECWVNIDLAWEIIKESAGSQLTTYRSEIETECSVVQIVVIEFNWICCSELVRILNKIDEDEPEKAALRKWITHLNYCQILNWQHQYQYEPQQDCLLNYFH